MSLVDDESRQQSLRVKTLQSTGHGRTVLHFHAEVITEKRTETENESSDRPNSEEGATSEGKVTDKGRGDMRSLLDQTRRTQRPYPKFYRFSTDSPSGVMKYLYVV